MTRDKFSYQDKVVLSVGQGKKGIYIFAEWHPNMLRGLIRANTTCQKNVKVTNTTKDKKMFRKVKNILELHAQEIAELYMFNYFEQSIKFFKYLEDDNK